MLLNRPRHGSTGLACHFAIAERIGGRCLVRAEGQEAEASGEGERTRALSVPPLSPLALSTRMHVRCLLPRSSVGWQLSALLDPPASTSTLVL
jgi:hypothetical protein